MVAKSADYYISNPDGYKYIQLLPISILADPIGELENQPYALYAGFCMKNKTTLRINQIKTYGWPSSTKRYLISVKGYK